jgi:hypothetical protein
MVPEIGDKYMEPLGKPWKNKPIPLPGIHLYIRRMIELERVEGHTRYAGRKPALTDLSKGGSRTILCGYERGAPSRHTMAGKKLPVSIIAKMEQRCRK